MRVDYNCILPIMSLSEKLEKIRSPRLQNQREVSNPIMLSADQITDFPIDRNSPDGGRRYSEGAKMRIHADSILRRFIGLTQSIPILRRVHQQRASDLSGLPA